MQIFAFSYLTLLSIGISLGHAQSQVIMADNEKCINVGENMKQQLGRRKSLNGNLKKRIEKIDEYVVNQQQRYEKTANELKDLRMILQGLRERLLQKQKEGQNELNSIIDATLSKYSYHWPSQLEHLTNNENLEFRNELKKLSKFQNSILKILNTENSTPRGSTKHMQVVQLGSIKVCWGVYTKFLSELGGNRTILQNIDKTLEGLIEEGKNNHEKFQQITQGLSKYLNKKEDAKIWVRSKDDKLLYTEELYPTSCADYDSKHCSNGKCRIRNSLYGSESFLVPCDDTTDGGGWTVIQRRIDGSEDFDRCWCDYADGFGDLNGEFWLGLDKIHSLTVSLFPVELLIQLKDHNDTSRYAKYGTFTVSSANNLYKLLVIANYEGNAGDSFSYLENQYFTTNDMNNAGSNYNYAVRDKGGWWYKEILGSNLNGIYYKTGDVPENKKGVGVNWYEFHGVFYSLKFVQMMIRPRRS